MKKIVIITLISVSLMVILSMMPTGATSDEVIDRYVSTTSFSSSNSSYLSYTMQFSLADEDGFGMKYTGNTGEKIVRLAVDLCEKLGNGGNESRSDTSGRRAGQFRYSQSSTSGYSGAEALCQSINGMLADSSQTRSISCYTFATFCWHTMFTGSSPSGTQCTQTVETNFQDIIEGDRTAEYIIEHAKPGGLLFHTKDGSIPPPKASNGNYRHAETYIGPYSGTDAHDNNYTLEYTRADSNEIGVNRDACIKSLENFVSTGRHVYLVPLEKWVVSGHTPVDSSDQMGSLDDILQQKEGYVKTKFGIIIAVAIIATVSIDAVLINYNLHSTMKTMQFIERRIRSSGTIVDYDQSIYVGSAEDLGWWKKGGNWYIIYGKLQLGFTPKQLEDQKFLEQVGRVGLDIRGDLEESSLHFHWYGTELEEWVPR